MTINKVCGSGLKAVMLAAQAIATGDIDIAVAGGMESMSNAPYLLPRVREGLRMGNGEVVDSMIDDGLWCSFDDCHMGIAGGDGRRPSTTSAARRRTPTRPRATARPRAATRDGWFRRRDPAGHRAAEEGRAARRRSRRSRSGRTPPRARCAALRPAFKKDGSVTAGNASAGQRRRRGARRDGRGASPQRLGLTPLARIVGQATSGLEPKLVMMTPVEAVRKVAEKVGWNLEDVDLFEINEAFSVQPVAVHARARHRSRARSTSTAARSPSATRLARAAPAC